MWFYASQFDISKLIIVLIINKTNINHAYMLVELMADIKPCPLWSMIFHFEIVLKTIIFILIYSYKNGAVEVKTKNPSMEFNNYDKGELRIRKLAKINRIGKIDGVRK